MKIVRYAIVVICLLGMAGLVAEETNAYFSGDGDIEQSSGNIFQAAAPEPEPPPSGGGGGGGIPGYPVKTNFFGSEEALYTNSKGEVWRKVEATSEDGLLTIVIPKGTFALDEDGKRLKKLEAVVDKDPPDPPKDANVIGLAYDFGPDGATFDPPITFTWKYDPSVLPEGVDEGDLVLAFYDRGANKWVELECSINTDTNIVTALVDHFTCFAIIGKVAEVEPVPPEPIEPVTVAPEPEPEPEPIITPTPIPPVTVPPVTAEAPIPWGLIIGLLVAAVVAGLAIWLIKRRRAAQ